MNLCIFAYDFPHEKTKDFILIYKKLGYDIKLIVAAPRVDINKPKQIIRSTIRSEEIIHPKELAEIFNIPYHVIPHEKCGQTLIESDIDLGIVAGARILPKQIIESCKKGILNFHPGIIPLNRGQDNMKWAIFDNIPQGVTTHFINERVDAGWIIDKQVIQVNPDDTFFDIDRRLYNTELKMIESTMEKISHKNIDKIRFPFIASGKSRSYMPIDIEKNILCFFDRYKETYAEEKFHF